jgi:4-aminobutyrate aminotransferase-like enzyme
VKEEIAEFMQDIVLHGHTHTAYPLMCCSALKNLEIINRENILTHVRKAGTYFLKKLTELSQRYESIGEVRGRGLLLGIDIVRNGQPDYLGSRQLTEKLLENGLIVELECFPHLETAVLVFHPPLIITEQQIEDIVGIMERVLDAPEDE